MRAAVERAGVLAAVADDAAAAVRAGRRQRMDGALEAVEGVGALAHHHLECLVVVVAAGVAAGHVRILLITMPRRAWAGGCRRGGKRGGGSRVSAPDWHRRRRFGFFGPKIHHLS